jgi:putative PEP-CTERM system TPR-repeat lipoprotein
MRPRTSRNRNTGLGHPAVAAENTENRMIGSRFTKGYGLRVVAPLVVILFFLGCGVGAGDVDKLMTDAKQQREKGNNSAAIIQLKNVLQKSPENAEARYLLGVIYNETGDFSSAKAELGRALELRYDPAKVIPPLAKSLLMQGEFQKVLDQPRIEVDAPNLVQAEILTLRALASIGLGREQEGRELLKQALIKHPEFADALLGQARLAESEGKPDEAARLIERAIASAPKSIEAWMMKGDLARVRTDESGATTAYQKVIELKPDNVLARLNIAFMQIAAGRFDDARKQVDQARKIAPNNLLAVYMQALIEFRKKNYTAARDEVLKVLKVAPDHLPSVLLAGAVEYALGSQAQAQLYLGRVLDREPNHLYARKLMVSSLAKSGQVTRALEMLQPALKQAPEDSALMILAGELYMQSNEHAKATQFFEKAAKLDPKSAGARTRLGQSRLALGETAGAVADLESAVQLDSNNYQADIILVMSYLQRKNYEQASKAMASLEKKQPNNPLTYNLKGAIFLGKNDLAAARKQFERATELQPTYIAAATNLAQLDVLEKNPQAARGRLEAVLKREKDNVQALLVLADLGPGIGATQKEQIDWLERASKASPGSALPQLMLSRLYARAGDTKKALTAAQQAQAISPDNPEVLATLGASQMGAKETNLALATYGKLVTLQPKSPVALYNLAMAQALSGGQAAAASTLKKALALKPDFVDAQVALVGLEILAGHYREAMKIAQQVQKQAAKSPLGFILEGDVWMAEKKFPAAVNAYETAYGIARSGVLAIKLHAAYAQARKPNEAEARLAQLLKESPDDAGLRQYAAERSLDTAKFKDAIEHYEWLQQKQPDNMVVLNNLAWAYQQVKDPRALETAERAYKLSDNPATTDTLGWILVEQGNTKRGLELLQKAVTAAPKTSEIRYHLAQAWNKAGDKAKARSELETVLSANPKFSQRAEAEKLLEQLRM